MKELLQNLVHPYSRYGLAIALFEEQMPLEDLTAENAPEVLAKAIEAGLENFRFMTDDNPETEKVLRFRPIKKDALLGNAKLVQSAGLANQGKYLAPNVVTTDGDAKGTFDNAKKIIELLRANTSLLKPLELSRSFAPTTAKINNGKSSQTPPKGTLFECACNVITTTTPIKPSAWLDGRNTVIIPDLPLVDETPKAENKYPLLDFIDLFQLMLNDALKENILEVTLDINKTEKKYSRPRIFWGNYPFAPREAAFGAVGLLGAIGKWGQRAKQIQRAERVLESIAGDETHAGRPMYVISYDNIAQVQFTHHVVSLAVSGKLSDMIGAFSYETRLYGDTDGAKPNRYSNDYKTNYELLSLMTGRFLQLFNQPAFQDFLAIRAEYSPIVEPLLKEYFMGTRNLDREIVESAQVMGQWLNRMAYFVAKVSVENEKGLSEQDRAKKIRQVKSKILTEIESAVMSAKTPQEMFALTNIRAVRLSNEEAPAQSTVFMNEAIVGEKLTLKDAQHLLMAYLRLRQNIEKSDRTPQGQETEPDEGVADQTSSNSFSPDMVA